MLQLTNLFYFVAVPHKLCGIVLMTEMHKTASFY